MREYEIQHITKTEILSVVDMLIDKIREADGVYASIHFFSDGNTTVSIYPCDDEGEDEK